MRKWINLVENQISEAPIADVGIHNMDEPGTFDASDLTTLKHPTWHARLVQTFRKVSVPVNVYMINFTKLTKTLAPNDNGDVSLVPPTGTGFGFDDWVEHISGVYQAADFEQNFGFVPPNYENSINMMFTNNFGDGKIPMTPWMVAHRFVHATAGSTVSKNRWWRRRDGEASLYFNRYFNRMQNTMEMIMDDRNIGYSIPDSAEIYKLVSSLKSAQYGRIDRRGEFYIELAAQYMLTGKLHFNTTKLEWLDENIIEYVERYLAEAEDDLNAWFSHLTGRIYVL